MSSSSTQSLREGSSGAAQQLVLTLLNEDIVSAVETRGASSVAPIEKQVNPASGFQTHSGDIYAGNTKEARSTSSASSASSSDPSFSSSSSIKLVAPNSRRAPERSRSYLPTSRDLYGNRHRNTHKETAKHTHSRHERRSHSDKGAIKEKHHKNRSRSRHHCSLPPAERSAKRLTVETDAEEVKDDALLWKMRKKEKEFDAKVREIDQTFYHAGHQLVVRNDMIDALQREVDRLRAALAEATHPSREEERAEHRQQRRELIDKIDDLTRKATGKQAEAEAADKAAAREVARLRDAVATGKTRESSLQATIEDLRKRNETSEAATREINAKHQRQIEKLRKAHRTDLQQLNGHFHDLEKRCAAAQSEWDGLEQARSQAQAQLLQLEMECQRGLSQENKRYKDLWLEKEAAFEDAEAARLSVARLLHVLSQVPAMRDYLEWNELGSEFVFLGYPTRYFPNFCGEGAGIRREGGTDDLNRNNSSRVSKRLQRDQSGYSVVGTGVEDGIYVGATAAPDSKNIWLNGQWVEQLRAIVNAENMFTRLKRIKLLEMEEAGQLSQQLPTAQDVLQCRRQEKDYWVPYNVFVEAQRFKNRYFPKIPALSHFYPFLMKVNALWNAKLQDRLRVMKKELREGFQQQQKVRARKQSTETPLRGIRDSFNDDITATHVLSGLFSEADDQRRQRQHRRNIETSMEVSSEARREQRAAMLGVERDLAHLQKEHHQLQREVRLRVTNQGSLQFFRLYDELVKRLFSGVQRALSVCEGVQNAAMDRQVDRLRMAEAPDRTYFEDEEEGDEHLAPLPRAPHFEPRSYRSGKVCDYSYSHGDENGAKEMDAAATVPPNRQHSPTSREIEESEEAIEHLLSIVQQTCERVCGVGDHLTARVLACSQDLQYLIHMLRDHTNALSHHGNKRGDVHQSASFSSSERPTGGAAEPSIVTTGTSHISQAELQQQIQEILRQQYGGESGVNSTQNSAALAPALQPKAGIALTKNGSIDPSALLQVADSVLDYCNEVRREVVEATEELRAISRKAIAEAESC